MEGSSEIVLPIRSGQQVRQYHDFITKLFGVNVEFTTDPRTAKRSGNEWLKVSGATEARKKAEVYIKGLANPEVTRVFKIPESIASNESWSQQITLHIQQAYGAVVRFLDPTQLILQGSQLAVGQALSSLEDFIARSRYPAQKVLYHAQPSVHYYQPHQYYQTGVPYERADARSPYMNTDAYCNAPEMMHTASMRNAGDAFQAKRDNQVVSKGAVLHARLEQQQQDSLNNAQAKQRIGENLLRDFAQKLDYTHEEINNAMAKFAATGTNQTLDENSLLQYLIQLYPRKEPSFKSNVDSKVVKDGASPISSTTTTQSNAKEVTSQEKEQAKKDSPTSSELRHIVVDGSNVAMSHGKKDVFSCKGIKLCVDYFKQRGHKEITVFVPQWRKEASKPDRPIEDQNILFDLEKEQVLSFTPSRRLKGQRVVCYDDRYIVKLAAENDGIIVSNDNFRDLLKENPEWKKVIEERLLMYTFVKDVFMPPDDPLGRRGPKLESFLQKGTQANPRLCPYMKKCTYGSKCKYYHPEKTSNDNNEQIKADKDPEPAAKQMQPDANDLQAALEAILPDHKERIKQVIQSHPDEKNLEKLCNMVLN